MPAVQGERHEGVVRGERLQVRSGEGGTDTPFTFSDSCLSGEKIPRCMTKNKFLLLQFVALEKWFVTTSVTKPNPTHRA